MRERLAENIRDLRRQRRLTQEQLATALNVTAGAVYKWESCRSTPELGVLLDMADLFEVSVDVLLGYQPRSRDREHWSEKLKELFAQPQVPTGQVLAAADTALRKYPNCFDIVYAAARLYSVRGTVEKDQKLLRRSMELHEQACRLIGQNTDPAVSELGIRTHMAELWADLGQHEKAVELLKRNNPCRLNSAQIGNLLASGCDRPDEAVPWLSEGLLEGLVTLLRVLTGYLNVYMKRQDYPSVVELMDWGLALFPGLKKPGKNNFLQRTQVVFLLLRGEALLRLERPEEAAEAVRQAVRTARAFDAAPSYTADDIRFTAGDGRSTAYDDFGVTLMAGLQSLVDGEAWPPLTALWQEVLDEAE